MSLAPVKSSAMTPISTGQCASMTSHRAFQQRNGLLQAGARAGENGDVRSRPAPSSSQRAPSMPAPERWRRPPTQLNAVQCLPVRRGVRRHRGRRPQMRPRTAGRRHRLHAREDAHVREPVPWWARASTAASPPPRCGHPGQRPRRPSDRQCATRGCHSAPAPTSTAGPIDEHVARTATAPASIADTTVADDAPVDQIPAGDRILEIVMFTDVVGQQFVPEIAKGTSPGPCAAGQGGASCEGYVRSIRSTSRLPRCRVTQRRRGSVGRPRASTASMIGAWLLTSVSLSVLTPWCR